MALNNNTLPQPTRSGTVNVRNNNNSRHNNGYEGDFPRGREAPRPSSSGVIDLTADDSSSNNRRGPKYHGGYKRNR
jgi:hypothetical protein